MTFENTNDAFRRLQFETQCPFAKSAKIAFARPAPFNASIPEAATLLHEDVLKYVEHDIHTSSDGLAIAISNSTMGNDFPDLVQSFNQLYQALKSCDGVSDEEIADEDIEKPDWQLSIAGQRLFTNVFSSLYPPNNSRHIAAPDTTFIFFQPEQSFSDRIPFDVGSAELQRLKSNIRARFAMVGLAYEGAIADNASEAVKYILPERRGMEAVRWWENG